MSSNHVNKELVRCVVIGKTGSGKSSVANILLGKKDRFVSNPCGSSITKTTEADEGYCRGIAVKVVDTPGFFDTNVDEEENKREIIRCLALSGKGPNIFFYCIEIGRFTKADAVSFRNVKIILGDSVTDYIVIVFTNKDKLDKAGKTEIDYIESAPSELNQVLAEVKKYPRVFIECTSENIETELVSLSTLIKDVNIDSYYTHDKYRSGIDTLKRFVDVGKEYKMAYTQWKENREVIVKNLSSSELYLNEMAKDVSISKIAGSVGGIVGSTIAVVGLVAAPLTAGASLTLTAIGAGIGAAGSVTGLGATIAHVVITKKRKNAIDTLVEKDKILFGNLGDKEAEFYQKLSELFKNNEITGVIQHVLEESKTRSGNILFGKGLDKARDYLRQFIKIKIKYTKPKEIDKEQTADVKLRAASTTASTFGHAAKTIAVAIDTTTDTLGSITPSAAYLVKAAAIPGVIVSAITLPIDIITIILRSHDLYSNKKHELAEATVQMKKDMENDDKGRNDLDIFVDKVAKFLDCKNDG